MGDKALDNEPLVFFGETPDKAPTGTAGRRAAVPWRILIVDDDPDVHTTTTFAMRGSEILGRSLDFLHADSALQARELMERDRDIAVVLLDVVLEKDDAGLKLVRAIRDDLGMSATRIIMRTGQPGRAPEMEAIRDYDINDYRTKSELTRNKLYATLTVAVRAYAQIHALESSRRALDRIVRASNELLAIGGLEEFGAGFLARVATFLGVKAEGLVCVQKVVNGTPLTPVVIATAGHYASARNLPLEQINPAQVRESLQAVLVSRRTQFAADKTCLFVAARSGSRMAAILEGQIDDETLRQSLEVFCASVAVGLENTLRFEQMRTSAYFDALTGLPNRGYLINLLDERMSAGERARQALVLLDIDGFADTNDALGHAFGDELLRAVATRLRQTLGSGVTHARLASDTFAVVGLVEQLLPARLKDIFDEPFVFDNQELMVSVTMGLVHLTDVDGNGAEALKCAYVALRRAKRGQRGEYAFFTRDMAQQVRERAKLVQALHSAVERQRLSLVYQPQVSLATGRVSGFEALVRWRTEDGTLVEPERFIPIAEHSGMIVAIGEWVLRNACAQQAALAGLGYQDACMAVNVSLVQFRHPRFLSTLRSALEESGVKPQQIELEITESLTMDEVDLLIRSVEDVKKLGVRVAIDDFGTGLSSFSYVQRLQVNRLKIDREFILGIETDDRARRVAEAMIQLAHSLGLGVLAEGVESIGQAELLRTLGCEDGQGYLYARPMASPQVIEWLGQRDAG